MIIFLRTEGNANATSLENKSQMLVGKLYVQEHHTVFWEGI